MISCVPKTMPVVCQLKTCNVSVYYRPLVLHPHHSVLEPGRCTIPFPFSVALKLLRYRKLLKLIRNGEEKQLAATFLFRNQSRTESEWRRVTQLAIEYQWQTVRMKHSSWTHAKTHVTVQFRPISA